MGPPSLFLYEFNDNASDVQIILLFFLPVIISTSFHALSARSTIAEEEGGDFRVLQRASPAARATAMALAGTGSNQSFITPDPDQLQNLEISNIDMIYTTADIKS